MECREIQGWFSEMDFAAYTQIVSSFTEGNFAEIGCWKGLSFCGIMPILLKNNYKNIYAIDHWLGSENEREHGHIEVTTSDIYQQFLHNLESTGFKDKFNILKMDSVEAAKQFEDGYFDVVFIDGDHTYEGISRDLDVWIPKIKSGGILSGHDVHHPPIVQALNERLENKWSAKGGGVWAATL